jgi:hypothetical protein
LCNARFIHATGALLHLPSATLAAILISHATGVNVHCNICDPSPTSTRSVCMRIWNSADRGSSSRLWHAIDVRHWAALLLVCAVAIITVGSRYWQPESLFWDENYHVASAHKQLAGVMYMENHPPLGKMLIALGEAAVGAMWAKPSYRRASALLACGWLR